MAELIAVVSLLFGIIATIIWLVIGWRAMRAHEQIAGCASEWLRRQPHSHMPYSAPNIPSAQNPQQEPPNHLPT